MAAMAPECGEYLAWVTIECIRISNLNPEQEETKLTMRGKVLGFVLLLCASAHSVFAVNPWVQSFTPTRTLYVSANGTGTGTLSSPMSLNKALTTSKPGDLYWMNGGTYTGSFAVTIPGTAAHPIVYRAIQGDHVKIVGQLNITAGYTWIWGLEVTDPNHIATAVGAGIHMVAPGIKLINNVVHDQWDKNGVNAWDWGPGQVLYGNIVYHNGENTTGGHPHGVYTQNDFSKNGYKYFVNNMFMDTPCEGCFNFHAYATNANITGYYVQQNIVADGMFIIGGYGDPADRETVLGNYYYNSRVTFGYARPSQVQFKDNYVARTNLLALWFWGDGETIFTQQEPNVFTGNSFILPPSNGVQFRTSAYLSTGKCQGCPRIQATDTFDNNIYTTPFHFFFFADNNHQTGIDFATWKSVSAAAGNAFDRNSTQIPAPQTAKVFVIPNEYEAGRANIAIYNWNKANNVTVDLSSFLSNGADYFIYKAEDLFGTPIKSGTYSGPVSVPMGGAEFGALVVLSTGGTAPPPDTTDPNTSITSNFCGTTVNVDSVTANWTGTDDTTSTGNLQFASKLDGGSFSSFSTATSKTFSNLSNGSHTIQAEAKDEAGNVDTTPASCTFTVNVQVADTTPPNTSITSNFCGTTVTTASVTAAWTGTDDTSSIGNLQFASNLDGGTFSSFSTATSKTFSNLSNGSHTIQAKAKDEAGNVDTTPDSCTFTVNVPDTTPPNTNITSNFCGTTVTTDSVTAAWTGTDDTTSNGNLQFASNLDGGSFSSFSTATSKTFSNLSNGSHTIQAKAKDEAGNVDATPDSCTFTVNVPDTTDPNTSITSNFCGTTVTTDSVTAAWTGTDDTTSNGNLQFASNLDGGSFSAFSTNTSKTFSNLANGAHTIMAKAKDEAGNVDTTPASCNFTVNVSVPDTTPPNTSITSNFCGTTVTTSSVTAQWTGTDDTTSVGNLQFASRLDGATFTVYSSNTSKTFNNLSNGSHSIEVKDKDEAGNVDTTPDSCSFTVDAGDTTAPAISNIAVNGLTLTNATITWDTDEASDGQVEYGTAACPCSTNSNLVTNLTTAHSITLTGLKQNTTYHYRVKSRDADGNLASSSDLTFKTGPGRGKHKLSLEAEDGTISSLEVDSKSDASQVKFVKTLLANSGAVTFNVQIPEADDYVIWTRVIGRSDSEDSFYVSVDGVEDVFDLDEGHWSFDFQWVQVNGRGGNSQTTLNPRVFHFSAGTHTIRFRGREENAVLDFLTVTNDTDYVPNENFKGVLSKIKAKKVTSTSAMIKWKTKNSLTNAQVEWGTSIAYGNSTPMDPTMLDTHKIQLTGLKPNVEYHYQVRSQDEFGNTFLSGDRVFLTPSQ